MGDRGTGSVYKRRPADRFWVIQYHDGQGRPIRETTSLTDKKAARDLLNQRLAAALDMSGRPGAHDYRLSGLEKKVLSEYALKGRKSGYKITTAYVRLWEFFGDIRAREITSQMLRNFCDRRLRDGAARATVRNELMALSHGYTLLKRDGELRFVPPAIPSIAVGDNARKGFFERAAFECVRSELAPPRQDVLTFLYLSGWRISEVVGLEWGRNVDLDRQVVSLEPAQTKTGQPREFPYGLFPEMAELIERRRRLTSQAELDFGMRIRRVFWEGAGAPVTRFLPKGWRRACDFCGVAHGMMHDLRRTAVRNLILAGIDRKVAMEITGHKTESVFRRYQITTIEDKRAALGRLGEFLEAERRKAQNVVRLADRSGNG
jgi:integrase